MSMKYVIKRACHLAGKDYYRGTHELPEEAENDPQFLKMVGSGLIEEAEEAKVISAATLGEKARKMLDKVTERNRLRAEAAKAAPTAETVTPVKPVKPENTQTDDSAVAKTAETVEPAKAAETGTADDVGDFTTPAKTSAKSHGKHGKKH